MAITINSHTNNEIVSGTETITATVTGQATNGFAYSEVVVDGVARGAQGNYPISIPLDTTLLASGNHTLVVRAKIKGAIYTSNTITINVQNVAASSISQSIVANSTLSGAVTWNATLSNITTSTGVRFLVDGVLKNTDATAPYSYSLDSTLLTDGSHTFRVEVTATGGAVYSNQVSANVLNVSTAAPVNTALPTITGPGGVAAVFSTVLDNFTRANEDPLSQSGAWTALTGLPALKVVSNQAVAGGAFAYGYRGSYTDAEVWIRFGTVPATENNTELLMRLKDSGAVSPIRETNKSGYSVTFDGKAGYQINKVTAGAYTTLRASTAWAGGPIADGDLIGCRIVGTTIEVWAKRGTAAAVKEFSLTDATHAGPGAIGLGLEGTAITVEDFGGGTVGSATYQQGQTLTGTNGTWTGVPSPTFTRQWRRCDAAGANCVSITGATAATYALVLADVDKTIRLRVAATNSAGSATADSAATPVIIASAPPPPPPPPGGTTITPAQFQALAVAGATITDKTVTGSVTVTNPDISMSRVVIQGNIDFSGNGHRCSFDSGTAGGFNIFGVNDTRLTNSLFDGHLFGIDNQNLIWDSPAGVEPQRTTITGNTFKRFWDDRPDANGEIPHSEALYIGYSDTGLVQGNTFTDNGNTGHIFFTNFGNQFDSNSYPRNWCVKTNIFQATHGAYFDINFHPNVSNLGPGVTNIHIDPDNVMPSGVTHANFIGDC